MATPTDRRDQRSDARSGPRLESLEGRVLLSVAAGQAIAAEPAFDPSRILVHFRDDPAGLNGANVLPGTGIGKAIGLDAHLREVNLGQGVNPQAALAAYQHNPHVEYAELNWAVTPQVVSNDPYYTNGSLWGMYGDQTSPTNVYGSQAGEAWAAGYTGSQDVYVGIIDEGIDYNHPDLDANVWTNPWDPADGIDNDGNGRVDDIHGWDFYSKDNSVYDGTADDHGTHVTGTIAGEGANGTGVAGVNWNVKYISGKFLGPNGGYTSDAISAIDYMTDLKTRHGMNIVALNNSWGGGGFSQGLLDAITRAANANILFIAAAGNGGTDQVGDNNNTTASYPSNYDTTSGAGYDSVIAVAAISSTGGLASFSNYGSTTVDIGAPGVGIYSTLPNNSYGSYSGTSMATPHVTGAAALYAATYAASHAGQMPSAQTIKSALLNSAIPTASLSGKTATGGRLDIYGALQQQQSVAAPDAPFGLTATATSGMPINLAWSQTASSNETGFRIERSAPGQSFAEIATVGSNVTSYTDSSSALQPNTLYTYRVRAYNAGGNSDYSNTASATTPQAVVNGTGTGLTGKYYDYSTSNTSVAPSTSLAFSSLKLTRTDSTINFNWGSGSPKSGKISNDTYAVRWTGQIEPRYTDTYTFTAMSDDGVRLWIDGQLVIDKWIINWGDKVGTVALTAGKHNFQLDYFENTQNALNQLSWQSVSQAKEIVPRSQLYPTTNAPIYAAGATGAAAATLSSAQPASAFSTTPIRPVSLDPNASKDLLGDLLG